VTAQRMRLARRQERLYPLPEPVAQPPAVNPWQSVPFPLLSMSRRDASSLKLYLMK
jgi:hypothetical protein